jgi:hypothetical protein
MEYKHPSNLTHVVLVAAVVVAVAVFCFVVRSSARAQTFNLAPSSWYGGRIVAFMPEVPDPLDPFVPLCPAHMVVADITDNDSSLRGIYFLGDGEFTYLYSTLLAGSNPYFLTPGLPLGTWVLGKSSLFPYFTCTTPYEVYPSDTYLFNYFLGTSLTP